MFIFIKKIIVVGSVFMSISAVAEGTRKISPEFRDEMLVTRPDYCFGQSKPIDCSFDDGDSISNLLSFKSKIDSVSFRKDLINVSVKGLLESKAEALKIFPELIPPNTNFRVSSPILYRKQAKTNGKMKVAVDPVGIDAQGDVNIKNCFEKNADIKINEFDKELTLDLQKNVNDLLSKQKEFVAQSILDAIKVNALWEESKSNSKELAALFNERVKLEKELKIVEDVNAGRFYEENNKKSGNSFLGVTSQELLIIAQNDELRKARQKTLVDKLDVLNQKIDPLLSRKEVIDKAIHKNPISVDTTEFIEKGNFKKSQFTEKSIKFIEREKGTVGKTLSGKEFLSSFNANFSKEPGNDYDGQILARIELMLANNPEKMLELTTLAQEAMKKKVQELDGSIQEICSTSGEKLHHFKPLVRKVMARNIIEAKKAGKDISNVEGKLKETHCGMLQESPYVDSSLGTYAVIGSGMLAVGVLTPVSIGAVLVGGEVAFAAVGAYETYEANKISRLSQGLSVVQLADWQQARADLSQLRVSVGWKVAEGALFPLKMIVKSSKVTEKLVKTSSAFPEEKWAIDLPTENWPLIALGRDENKKIASASTLESFAEKMGKRLHRNIVTYKKFTETPYLDENEKWFKISPEYSVMTVEKTVRSAIEMHPGKKVIIFELDNYDPSFLKNQKGEDVFTYTNFEVRLICNDKDVFKATAWYLKGKILTNSEVKRYFGKHINCSP